MDLWEWITSTTSVDSIFTTLGLGALALLFARDSIMTKGQHERRTADLVNHHDRELGEKEKRIGEMRESRDGYKEAARLERERADRATAAVGEIAETLEDIMHVLQSLDRALPTPVGGAHDPA